MRITIKRFVYQQNLLIETNLVDDFLLFIKQRDEDFLNYHRKYSLYLT